MKIISTGLTILGIIGMVPFILLLTPAGEKHVFIWFTVLALCGYSAAVLGSVHFSRELVTNSNRSTFAPRLHSKNLVIHNV